MSGSRQLEDGSTKPRRRDGRIAMHRQRVHSAPTGRRQAAAAFDRLRSAAVHHPDAERLLYEIATDLNDRAVALEGAAA
jgi:hypothetical protein